MAKFNTKKINSLEVLKKLLSYLLKYRVRMGLTLLFLVSAKIANVAIPVVLKEIVDYVKSLNIPVICFPKGIKNYKKFTKYTNPDVISIDYETDPKKILNDINIPIQGGLDPKILLSDKNQIKKEVLKYKNIFKDHPYIFNLGHGVLPETDPNMVEYLVNFVKNN